MNKLKFKNGDELNAIGLGTWKSEPELVENAVKYALENGYRHIDCAKNYANEQAVGRAFNTVFPNGDIKREDVWITSKLWNNAHKKEDVIPALKQTLSDLKLDYLDLYLMHWPIAFKPEIDGFPKDAEGYLSLEEVPIIETWEMMLEAKKQGLIKHAGVSNFSSNKLDELATKTDDIPEMLQVEMHPYLPQDQLMAYCKEKGINMTAYSPLGSGDRAEAMKADNEPDLLGDKTIGKIAEKHQVHPAQVLIKWVEQRGVAVIPKSTTESHITSNLESAEIDLDEEDLKAIADINTEFRYVNGRNYELPGNSYENIFDL